MDTIAEGYSFIIEYDGEEMECDIINKLFRNSKAPVDDYIDSQSGEESSCEWDWDKCTADEIDFKNQSKNSADIKDLLDISVKNEILQDLGEIITEPNETLEEKLFVCTECNFVARDNSSLKRHLKVHAKLNQVKKKENKQYISNCEKKITENSNTTMEP